MLIRFFIPFLKQPPDPGAEFIDCPGLPAKPFIFCRSLYSLNPELPYILDDQDSDDGDQ
jgi:hypothetical protein